MSKVLKNIFFASSCLWCIFGLISCQKSPSPTLNFYYWKTQFHLENTEKEYLRKLNSEKLYIRLFDVDFHPEQGAIPVGNTQIADTTLAVKAIVGVVFITNRTMLQISPSALDDLAEKITKKIFQKTSKLPLAGIQLDCDWTEKSQENFFTLCSFVRQICKQKNLEFSVTIRLHQFKYFSQTGVPPADKGVLMLYNLGDIDGKNTENSILELPKAESYLKNAEKYPLPLAVALPLFRWAVVQRMGKTVHLLSQIEKKDLVENPKFEKVQKNIFIVKENHYFGGAYLYEGDNLRWEEITPDTLAQLAKITAQYVKTQEIIFYHLETKTINAFGYEKLKNLAHHWH